MRVASERSVGSLFDRVAAISGQNTGLAILHLAVRGGRTCRYAATGWHQHQSCTGQRGLVLVEGGNASGAKDRGNPFVNGYNKQDGLLAMRW